MRSARGRSLIYLATSLSLGHHVDHVLRGHTGWPLTDDVTPFTYSLAVYPLILLGLVLSRDAGYWLLLSGPGALFVAAVHLGPTAVEPPQDIVESYADPVLGWSAFGELIVLIAVLSALSVYEARLWRRSRQDRRHG